MYVLGEASKEKLKGVHPLLVKLMTEAVKESPYDFRIVQGVRTAEYQNGLYQQGRTKPGKIVTNCDGYKNKSNHQAKSDGYGYAVDFGIYDPSIKGNIDWKSTNKYQKVARHIELVAREFGIKVEWGGDWKSLKDNPHIELKKIVE